MGRGVLHFGIAAVLTLLTQLGGIAWLVALRFRHRLAAFVLAYALLWAAALWIAPMFGRAPIPCLPSQAAQISYRMQSPLYCLLNRHYAAPELLAALDDIADGMAVDFAGTQTRVLDAGFPFLDGMPLWPHLSHHDGRKLDLAFYYRDAQGYRAGVTRSPIGYFAFEEGAAACPPRLMSLRWDLDWLQPIWRDLTPEPERMRALLQRLTADPRIGKLFIEPHLKARYGVESDKIRFQGCRAARHDDHIHIQL